MSLSRLSASKTAVARAIPASQPWMRKQTTPTRSRWRHDGRPLSAVADMAARTDSQLRMHLENAPGKRTTGSIVKHNRDGLMKDVVFSEDGNAGDDHEKRVLAARREKEQKLRGGEQSRKLNRLQTCTSMKPTSAAKADPLKLDDEQETKQQMASLKQKQAARKALVKTKGVQKNEKKKSEEQAKKKKRTAPDDE